MVGPLTPRLSLRAVLLVSHLVVLTIPLVAVLGSGALARDLVETRTAELSREGALIARMVARETVDGPVSTSLPLLEADLEWAAQETGAGVRLVDPDGYVHFASGPGRGAFVGDRPEVQAALAGTTRSRVTEGAPAEAPPAHEAGGPLGWLFVAVPVTVGDEVRGAVLLSRRTREDTRFLREVAALAPPSVLVAVAATLTIALVTAGVVGGAFRRLAAAAREVADGGPTSRVVASAARAPLVEVGALADAVGSMADRLAGQARQNKEFAAHTAHEFKTPLATLRATVQILADDADLPDAQRQRFLDNAATDLDRLARMVDGLLSLARAEEGPSSRVAVDLGALARSVAEDHDGDVIVSGASIVEGDPAQLERALVNLVDNALDHGAPPVRVEVHADGFSVRDAGPGVPPEARTRVFERFFTTSADRRGTGLGLPIVAAIARAHGGDVTLDEDGRCFRVRIGRG